MAAKPTAMPPMPPNASTPEMLNPSVCSTTRTEVMTTETFNSLAMASMVVGSMSFSPSNRFCSPRLMMRTRNQAMAAMITVSRRGSTASKITAPVAPWIISVARYRPPAQMISEIGFFSASRMASSQTLLVFSALACSFLRTARWIISRAKEAKITRNA